MSKHPDSQLPLQKIIQDVLNYTSMNISKFSDEVGFNGGTRLYAVFNENKALGVDSYHSILKRFPELNGDRFIRKSGPLLLSELCEKNTPKESSFINNKGAIAQEDMIISKSEDYYLAIIQGKENEITRLEKQVVFMEKQVAFMEKMLDK